MPNARYTEAIEQFAAKTTELAQQFRERGDVETAQIEARSEAWLNSDPLDNVTTRRENAAQSSVMYDKSLAVLRANIEALQAELTYLQIFIHYCVWASTWDAANG